MQEQQHQSQAANIILDLAAPCSIKFSCCTASQWSLCRRPWPWHLLNLVWQDPVPGNWPLESCFHLVDTAGAVSVPLVRGAGTEAPAAEGTQPVKAACCAAESGSPAASPVLATPASPLAVQEPKIASTRQPTRGRHAQAHSKLLPAAAAAGQPEPAEIAPLAAAGAGRPRRAKAPSRLAEGGSPATSPEPAAAAAGQLELARDVAPAAEPGSGA